MRPMTSLPVFPRVGLMALAAVAASAASLVPTIAQAPDPCLPPVGNPVYCENQLAGAPASEWDVNGVGDPSIQGFATDISVNHGQTIAFKVNTDANQYRLDIYRLGYYGGMGARKVATVLPSVSLPQSQPMCLSDTTTGLVDCGNWAVSASWAVPSTAVSGIYFARLVRTDTGGASHIVFIVRNDEGHSDLLFQTSDTTWQAYNDYGGNSLYVGSPAGRAYKVSYNRPFITRNGIRALTWLFGSEYPMVRWLEANGYDVSYFTGVDTHRSGAEILEHRVFLSVGHDEYWSGQQRANVEAARNTGVHLAFLSGNEIFWRTRWESSIDGSSTPNRTLVTYKETHANAKIDPSPEWTGTWRDPRFTVAPNGASPENAVSGTIFMVNCCRDDALTVSAAEGRHRFWRNTSIASLPPSGSASIPGMLGHEWDVDADNGSRPSGLVRLSTTTMDVPSLLLDYGSTYGTGTASHSLTLYRHSSGALVFGAGTIQWPWSLDTHHDGTTAAVADIRIQQATVNLLADMQAQPRTLQAGLTPATASTDTVPPTATITSPANGANVQLGNALTIVGSATDAGGAVGAVEVSTDGGASWHPATGTAQWTYVWTPTVLGTATIQARAIDDSGNRQSAPTAVNVNVGSRSCPCSLWSNSTVPVNTNDPDTSAIEVGVKFTAESDGWIQAIRFYKGSLNTGSHLVNLWRGDGALLATAPSTGETASGWQQVPLTAPVAVSAGVTYVASYHSSAGRYAGDADYFASSGFTNSPLTALPNSQGGNGVFVYGASAFPTQSYRASNYWVDVVFSTGSTPPADTTPPVAVPVSPTAGATNVSLTATVVTAFSEPVQASTVNTNTVQLLTPTNTAVAATVTYDAWLRRATLQPSAALNYGTTYTAVVRGAPSGVADLAGNQMAADLSWTFTTVAAPRTCPCSLWDDTVTPASLTNTDSSSVEVGVRFTSDSNGWIQAIRFYKLSANTGPHVVNLWSSTGTLLASASSTGETPSGWQQVTLPTSVAITAGTVYVASYYSPTGHYAGDADYFASGGYANSPLRALANSEGGNGVYVYGSSAFPTNSYRAANYWVDVSFVSGAAPPDTTPPTVLSQGPTGTGVSVGAAVTATFSESMLAGTITGSTVQLFAGATAVPATVTYDASLKEARLQPSATLQYGTVHTAVVRGGPTGVTDLAGNPLAADVSWNFTTAAAPRACPCSLWDNATVPGSPSGSDVASIEVGVKFTSDSNGYIKAIRFYKGSGNIGTHIVNLWRVDGVLLASAPSNAETATGWQEVAFSSPVAIVAGATYVASYFTSSGHYAGDAGYFSAGGFTNAPLTALANSQGGNGVYRYGTTSGFPASSFNGSNYWVDVVFDTAAPVDTTAPTVSAVSPAAGATNAPVAGPVTATFSESIDAATVTSTTLLLRNLAGTLVPATVGTDGASVVVLQPASPLAYGASYTARAVGGASGIKDRAGNPLAADFVWTFTTEEPSVGDTTVGDFAAGTADSGIYIAQTTNGELMLTPLIGTEFSGSAIPAGWATTDWVAGATVSFAGGVASVDGSRLYPTATTSGGASLEFGATFSQDAFEHVGFGITLTETPYAIFSTAGGGGVYARTHDGVTPVDTLVPGNWTGTPHAYRIDWNPSSVVFFIDGVEVVNRAVTITGSLRPIVSDVNLGNGALTVDWLRMTPYATSGSFLSRVMTLGSMAAWSRANWNASVPASTTLILNARFGNTPAPDTSWTGFLPLASSGASLSQSSTYVQYHALFAGTGPGTPILRDVTFAGTLGGSSVQPSLSIGNVSVNEGDSGTANAVFTVTLSVASTQNVAVNFATADGTATAGSDYTSAAGSLTFAPGETTKPISVAVQGDMMYEPNETFTVNLSNASGATIAVAVGTATITNNDPQPTLSINSVSVTEGNSGTTNAVFTVSLSNPSYQTITASYATADGTAAAGSDYTSASGPLTFAPGTTSLPITVAVTGDVLDEPDETFVVTLSNATNATIGGGSGTGTIIDDDPQPSLAINDVTVTEGDTGSVNAVFTVTLSAASGRTVTVNYATANNTAVAGSDYTATSGQLSFAPGQITKTVTVVVLGDLLDEDTETFFVNLSGPTNATIADAQGVGSIIDNDPMPALTINDVTVTEGDTGSVNAVFTVTLSAASGRTVTVNYATANNSAVAGSDYTATSGQLSFAPGQTTKTVTVLVLGDLLDEANETFFVDLSGAINATIADSRGVGTITDNDPLPSLSINDVSLTEGNSGTKAFTFTVTLSPASGRTVTVNFVTANGTARAGTSGSADYVGTSGTLTFSAGSTTRSVTVSVRGDTTRESNETFFVNLSGASNATIADGQGLGTIVNDD